MNECSYLIPYIYLASGHALHPINPSIHPFIHVSIYSFIHIWHLTIFPSSAHIDKPPVLSYHFFFWKQYQINTTIVSGKGKIVIALFTIPVTSQTKIPFLATTPLNVLFPPLECRLLDNRACFTFAFVSPIFSIVPGKWAHDKCFFHSFNQLWLYTLM